MNKEDALIERIESKVSSQLECSILWTDQELIILLSQGILAIHVYDT